MKNILIISIFLFVGLNGSGQNKELKDTSQLFFRLKIEPVKDIETDEILTDVIVRIVGSDNSDTKYISDSVGVIPIIELKENTTYSVFVESKGHLTAKGKEITVGKSESLLFVHAYKLKPFTIPYCPVLPEIYYKKNSVEPIKIEYLYSSLYDVMIENPNIIVQIIGYRNKSEKNNLSKKRAIYYTEKLIKLGIAKQRLKIYDGGLFEDSKRKDTYLTFRVISSDYDLK